MRTLEQFTATYSQAEWFVYFHNKPVWLVPLENDYAPSVIKPRAEEIPYDALAVLYGIDVDGGLKLIEQVASAKQIFDRVAN